MELQLPGVQQASDHLLRQLRQEDDTHIGAVVVHVVNDGVHTGLLDGEVEAAVPGGIQHPQEGVLGEGIPLGGDGEAGGGRRVPGLVEPLDALLLFQQGDGVAEELLALRGELHAPVAADEELDAQLLLQLPDGGGDAGLGQYQLVGRLIDGPALGDLHHVGQLLKGHAAPSLAVNWLSLFIITGGGADVKSRDGDLFYRLLKRPGRSGNMMEIHTAKSEKRKSDEKSMGRDSVN